MNKSRVTLNRTFAFICLSYIILFCVLPLGCSEKPKEKVETTPATKTASKPEKPKYDFPDEIYGDPKIWIEPRIQFVWEHPDDGGLRSIWSMKMDGTDVRRAVGPDLLAIDPGKKYAINIKPVRSPDCRYIAVAVTDFITYDVAHYTIIDLKTKTKKMFPLDPVPPYFNWTRDSRSLLFDSSEGDLKYDVITETLGQTPEVLSQGFYLINNDQQILALDYKALKFYDRKGNFLNKVELPIKENFRANEHSISADKRYLQISIRGVHYYLIKLEPPYTEMIYFDGDKYPLSNFVFLPGDQKLVGDFYNRKGLSMLKLEDRTLKVLDHAELKSGFLYMSLINYQR